VKAVFVELPAFERRRADYLDDAAFRNLQDALMKSPDAGRVIEGTGGLRKMRFADARRGKGKRGGLRVIYYWYQSRGILLLLVAYAKTELDVLTPTQLRALRRLVEEEFQ